MRITNLFVIALRLAALYFLYKTLTNIISTYGYLIVDTSTVVSATFLIITQVIVPFVAFVILWTFPNTLARLVIKPNQDELIRPINSIEWLRIIVLGTGFFMAIWAFLDAIYWSIPIMIAKYNEWHNLSTTDKSALITTGIEFLVGLILISKNTWIAKHLYKVNAPELPTGKN